MKHTYVALLTIVAAVLQFGCEESVEQGLTAQELEQKVIDKIEKNEGISYDLFRVLGEGVDAETLNRLNAASETQEEFITSVATESDDYFEEVVEMNMSDFKVASIPMPYRSAELKVRKLAGVETANALPYWDWEKDYSALILEEIETQAKDGHKEWIIIDSFDEGSTAAKSMPSESVSLNYAKVKMMASEIHKVYMNMSLTDEQVLVTINEIMINHDVPPVAIALLVPAVQKVRDAAAKSEPFGDALKVYLDETVGEAINGGLNRDIIRRIHAVAFLAGLHTIILPEYDNANQDLASLSIMHARYRAAIMGASGGVWKTTNF
ncbi:MAG TPA: hypothetical protein VFU05_12950 [Cyclobacteriaceae bacterium]|nr:hypothetical protein [Cyclobacteriaceae bacterium]